ncbi:hypothetical protein [Leekyejoonella antrihumi]|uniref:DUF4829 domain-containing protein n=1 Tax=Leekyejoonella antrihumi TaxID=1660198 RepID=A0A563E4U5_9MICO|nr:hypothetical protein [Leekyejoonella antrihumi]TWP37221.1 hypothetical protein FGL98_07385 [Leekyejoonella antrihumi]
MKWYRVLLLAVLVVIVVPVGGLWLWGRPRAHVPLPTARASPVDVVKMYVRAMNDRDFSVCTRMQVSDGQDIGAGWASLPAPNITNLRIGDVHAMTPGLRSWNESVVVDTTATLNNFEGFHNSQPDQPWSFELVRHDSSKPWRIIDQGQG